MDALIISIFVLVVGIGILVSVASYLEKRAKKEGNLFTGRASTATRIIGFIFGLVFGSLALYEMINFHEVTVELPILAVACLVYSLGWNSMLDSIQKSKK